MRFTASYGPRFRHGPGQTQAPSPTRICQGAACIAVWPARKSRRARPGEEKGQWYGRVL